VRPDSLFFEPFFIIGSLGLTNKTQLREQACGRVHRVHIRQGSAQLQIVRVRLKTCWLETGMPMPTRT
jgi:hypothetical protein